MIMASNLFNMLIAGITALAAAALDGKLDTLRYLLDNGADPNKKDDPGSVPLHCAAKNGSYLHILLYLTLSLSLSKFVITI
jgi:ankyrin repeat protein